MDLLAQLRRTLPGMAAVFLAVLSPAVAQDGDSRDFSAERILQDSFDHLKSLEEFRVSAEITYDEIEPTGQKLQYGASVQAAVRRPDRLRTDYYGDQLKRSIWYDGGNLTILDLDDNLFATLKAPTGIDALLDNTVERLGFTIPLSDILYSDPYPLLHRNVAEEFYAGLHVVGGVSSHHLMLSQKDIDWQIWVEATERHLPRKLIITYKNLPGSPQYTILFSEWDLSPQLANDLFIFRPPSGSNRIQFLDTFSEKEITQ